MQINIKTKHTYTYEKKRKVVMQTNMEPKKMCQTICRNTMVTHAQYMYNTLTNARAHTHTHTHTHNMVPHACCGYIGVYIRLVREHIYIDNTYA